MGAGGALSQAASPVTRGVGSVLASSPVTQLATAATGGAAADVTGQLGGGPVAQLAAGLAGSVGPAVAANALRPRALPPTTEQLRGHANAAYKAADDSGLVIAPNSFATRVAAIAKTVGDEGIDPTLHPRATAALNRLQQAGAQPVTLQQAETLRRVVKSAASSIEPDERRIAQIMVGELDDYIQTLRPSDVLAGNASAATSALREARNLWSRMSKAEAIEDLMDRAKTRAQQFTGSGEENAIRTEFRQLVMNPRRMRVFTQAEQEAIRHVARGGPVGNLMRHLGRFAARGPVSAGLDTMLGGGVGFAVGGPLGAMIGPAGVMALGEAGRAGATALTKQNARAASELMRAGPQALPQPGTLPAYGGALGAGATVDPSDPRRRLKDAVVRQ